MIVVPPDLYQPLAPLLAIRGCRVMTDQSAGAASDIRLILARDPPHGPVPWIALVGDAAAAVAAFDGGADDVAMAGDPPALIAARLARALGRRSIRVGDLDLDPVARRARRGARALTLLPREFAVLHALVRHPDRIVSRAMLRSAVWGRDRDPGTNVIEVHVSRLRAELDRDAPAMLRTERGRGYRLVSQP